MGPGLRQDDEKGSKCLTSTTSAPSDAQVDTRPSVIYKPRMICAFPRLMKIADSRGFAVGPEGMRVR